MKIKDIEGDITEIRELFDNQGMNLEQYLQPEAPLKKNSKLVLPIVTVIFLLTACMIWIHCLSGNWAKILIIVSICFYAITIISVHLDYKNKVVTTITGFGGLLILLVGFEVYTPKEAIKEVKDRSMQYLPDKEKDSLKDKKKPR